MKFFIYLMSALMLVATAEARGNGGKNGNNKKVQEQAKQKEKEKKDAKDARDKKRNAIQKVLAAKDGNNDGSLTLDEYLSDEADKEAATKAFNEANKNGDRYLTKSEISDMLGL